MSTFFSGKIPKVNRAISGGDTVSAEAYAIVTYLVTSIAGLVPDPDGVLAPSPITRYFGPGQSIPASFTSPVYQMNQSSAPWHTTRVRRPSF